jgi:alpha-L-rhamnosidase
MRVVLTSDPFADLPADASQRWNARGRWPAQWISSPEPHEAPHVVAYKNELRLASAARLRLHVSADERYELFVDGRRIGRGPTRGSAGRWYFESYDLALSEGEHVLVVRVFTLGPALAPSAQVGLTSGLVVCPDPGSPLLGEVATGVAPWQAKTLEGLTTGSPHWSTAASGDTTFDAAAFAWGFEMGGGDGWQPVRVGSAAVSGATAVEHGLDEHLLYPCPLPPMMSHERSLGRVRHVSSDDDGHPFSAETHLADEAARWQALADGGSVALPAHTRRRILFDLEDYVCAYSEIVTSGGAGARIMFTWAEALVRRPDREPRSKEHRDATSGMYLVGPSDTVLLDGGAHRGHEPWWWRCGRYAALLVTTADEPVAIERAALSETRYPLERQSTIHTSDPRTAALLDICARALEVCCHETYQDCPLYEQQQWVGDMRTQILAGYTLSRDDRAARNAIEMVAASREPGRLTAAYWPARTHLTIPAFALAWIATVYDLALFRGHEDLVRRVMPEVRASIDVFFGHLRTDGLVGSPPGWCFNDWAKGWHMGIPPDGDTLSGLLHWQLVMVLGMVHELERWLGEPELAARAARRKGDLARAATRAFLDEERGLFADDVGRRHFSEHTQALAVLSGAIDDAAMRRIADALVRPDGLVRARMFFSHWVFEALVRLGRIDAVFERLSTWHDFVAYGFVTTPEHDGDTRSDCHGWGAHPLYHHFTGIAGIRPADFGFRAVRVEPQLGPLEHVRARLVHPGGFVEVELRRTGGVVKGTVTLPEGVGGTYRDGDGERALAPGHNDV